MVLGSAVYVFVSVYAPQANLSESVKNQLYYALQSTIARVSSSEQLIISGDWDDHIGSHSTAFEDVHGGQASSSFGRLRRKMWERRGISQSTRV